MILLDPKYVQVLEPMIRPDYQDIAVFFPDRSNPLIVMLLLWVGDLARSLHISSEA